jgi:hypothetical protein
MLLILKTIKIFKKYYQSIVVMWQHMFSVPVMRTVWRRVSPTHTQYFACGKIEKNEMGKTCGPMGEGRGVYRVLMEKPEGKRPLGRSRRRWEDDIKMDLQEVGGGCGDWMELAQDRDMWRALVNMVRNF